MFSPIAAKLREKYDGIFVASEYTDTPARFPAVTIIEISNVVVKKMITTTIENASKIAFEVNCFSNKVGGAKIQARDIIETVDFLIFLQRSVVFNLRKQFSYLNSNSKLSIL